MVVGAGSATGLAATNPAKKVAQTKVSLAKFIMVDEVWL